MNNFWVRFVGFVTVLNVVQFEKDVGKKFINYIYLVEWVMKFLEEENFLLPCPPLGKVLSTFPHQKLGSRWIRVMKVHHLANLHQYLYSQLYVSENIDCSHPSIYLKI